MYKNGGVLNRIRNTVLDKLRGRRSMDVTRQNFQALLPDIEEAIKSSSFIAIDGEFTGLNAYRGISPFDLPDQRYDKLQESARQFLLIQFGLCTFHYDEATDSYSNLAYNFYVWPRPASRQAPDPRFLCQTSSLDFLISQDFDFNRLLKDGISYLRPAELEKLISSTMERQAYKKNLNTNDQIIPVPPEQEGFLKEVCTKLNTFAKGAGVESIQIDRCNAFQRRLIYQTAREKYPNLSLTSINKIGGERVLNVTKLDNKDQKKMADLQDEAELAEVEESFGFSRVIQAISKSKKLVVGHNMVLDLCHTLNQFVSPLPEQYSDFKDMCSTIFPNIIDTKLMANTIPFKDEIYNSSLKELLATVSDKPYNMPKITERLAGQGYTQASEKYHEAGYDAFITGLCLISMQRRLARICEKKPSGCTASCDELAPFLNKLYLMKISDIPYMNLAGEDLLPDRNHVFYLEIPKEWKTQDLVHLFSSFGYVSVTWVNDTSVFVALKEKAFAITVIKALQSSSLYTITSYDGYLKKVQKEKLEGGSSIVAGLTPSPRPKPISLLTPSTDPALRRRDVHTARRNQTSGITPTMEKAFVNGSKPQEPAVPPPGHKRPVSPETIPAPEFKRTKSVVEESKTFDEPPWD